MLHLTNLPNMNYLIALPPVLQGCNLAHVLGLFRITGVHTTVFALGARGALADMALWAIARLQTRLFASRTFAKCAFGPAPSSKGHHLMYFYLLARMGLAVLLSLQWMTHMQTCSALSHCFP